MRLINADDKLLRAELFTYTRDTDMKTAINAIDKSPTIDAVEVVRCKDCKHYSVMGETTQFGFCKYRHAGTDETDYCSRAVRRKE